MRYEYKDDYEWIRVVDTPERNRYLHFETSIQGAINLEDHRVPVFEYIALMAACARQLCRAPGKILLGGLGCCALHHASRHSWPAARLISIECNARVYELAKRFFRLEPRAKVLIGDLRRRLETQRKLAGFDLILIDCYTATSIPPHLTSIESAELFHRKLVPGGLLVSNLWDPGCNELCGDQVRTVLEVFGKVALIDCRDENNLIVCSARGPIDWPDEVSLRGSTYPIQILDRERPRDWPEFVGDAEILRDDNLGERFDGLGMVI